MQAANTNNTAIPARPPVETFVVKQWRSAHILIAAFIYLVGFLIMYNVMVHGKPGTRMAGVISGVFFVLLAIPVTMQAFSKKIYIEVNKAGIYAYGALLAGWEDFIAADYYEKLGRNGASIFIVRIWHREQGIGDFEANLPIQSTLTKSPEEVIAAIKHFLGAWKAEATG